MVIYTKEKPKLHVKGMPEEAFESDFIKRLFDIDEKDFMGNEKFLAYMKQNRKYER